MNKIPITNLSKEELAKKLQIHDIESYRANQIFRWIFNKNIHDFEKMTDIPRNKLEILKENFLVLTSKLMDKKISKDGTVKFLIKLADDYYIETVLLKDRTRNTICVSTQVGCALKCRFCLSGKFEFKRNLTTSEIIDQLLIAADHISTNGRIDNIVFMGMGEPLLNIDNVLRAIEIITSSNSFNIGARKITVSTSGIIPGIDKLSSYDKQIRLSISLHSPFQKVREKLMPIGLKYNLNDLIKSIKNYSQKTKREITFEYILIDHINNSDKDIHELSKILKGIRCTLNIIPYNNTNMREYLSPNNEEIRSFFNKLEANGIKAILRKRRGSDIDAACGQLSLKTIFKEPEYND